MAATPMLLESMAGIDPTYQIAMLHETLASSAAAIQEIASLSARLVTSTIHAGPEVSIILNLALQHGMLHERALVAADALLDHYRAKAIVIAPANAGGATS